MARKSNRPAPSPAAPAAPQQAELSLDELSAAFAAAMEAVEEGSAAGPPADEEAAPDDVLATRHSPLATPLAALDDDAAPEDLAAETHWELTPPAILEALLFVGDTAGGPLPAERLTAVLRGVDGPELAEMVGELNAQYRAGGCPYEIASEGAGYRLTLRPEHHALRDRFYGRIRQARLSQAAIDVLALVAYHEPLTADEVNRLRGAASGAILTQLVRRQLLRMDRSPDHPRLPQYSTTRRFLDLFGLATLADLPTSQDLDQK